MLVAAQLRGVLLQNGVCLLEVFVGKVRNRKFQETSSYSGSGVNVTPEQEFAANEFSYTSFDERHRFTLSGVFQLPWGFEVAPLMQAVYVGLEGSSSSVGSGTYVAF